MEKIITLFLCKYNGEIKTVVKADKGMSVFTTVFCVVFILYTIGRN